MSTEIPNHVGGWDDRVLEHGHVGVDVMQRNDIDDRVLERYGKQGIRKYFYLNFKLFFQNKTSGKVFLIVYFHCRCVE